VRRPADDQQPVLLRDPRASGTGLIDDFTLQPQNVANFRTSGLDVNLNYRFAVKKIGAFELKLIGSYLNKLSTIGTPGAEPTDERGQAYYYSPKYQLYASATYSTGRFAFNYNMSWWDKTLRYTLVQQANNPTTSRRNTSISRAPFTTSTPASMCRRTSSSMAGSATCSTRSLTSDQSSIRPRTSARRSMPARA
jgi:hypothetical protein